MNYSINYLFNVGYRDDRCILCDHFLSSFTTGLTYCGNCHNYNIYRAQGMIEIRISNYVIMVSPDRTIIYIYSKLGDFDYGMTLFESLRANFPIYIDSKNIEYILSKIRKLKAFA